MLERCKLAGRHAGRVVKSVGKWIAERIKDLIYGVGNDHLDAGRTLAAIAMAMMVYGEIHNIRLHVPVDLGPGGLGGGLTGVLGALGAYIFFDRRMNGGSS